MDEGVRLLAAANHGLITARAVQEAGITRARLRWAATSGELRAVRVGTWCPVGTWDTLDDRHRHLLAVRAAQLARPTAVAAAQSAAVVLDLPLPDGPPPEPILLTGRDVGRRGGDGVKGRGRGRRAWLDTQETWTMPDGLRVTDPARTVVDLARHLEMPWALAAADVCLRRWRTTSAHLLAAAQRNPCAPGHPAAVLVATEADARAESALESVARGVMVMLRLPRAEPQVWVPCPRQRYRVDLRVARFWTVVEADGKVKYRPDTTWAAPGEQDWRDKRRRDDLHDAGQEVVRFVRADAHHPSAWGRRCVRAFRRAHERRGLTYPGPLTPWL